MIMKSTIVSVYSSNLSADTSLWCCWNKSPRKAWKEQKQKQKNEQKTKMSSMMWHLHSNGSSCWNLVWLSTELEKQPKNTRVSVQGLASTTSLLLPTDGLSFSWTGLLKRRSLHLELLGRYVAAAVHVILPPDLQYTGHGELISENTLCLEAILWRNIATVT